MNSATGKKALSTEDEHGKVIEVNKLFKDFKLPHQRAGTLKNVFTGIFSKRSRSFEIQHALKDISFSVEKGEFFGVVGRNGSGKSTLLKILAGIYQPTKGSVSTQGRIVPFIELGVGFNGELSGRENVYLNGALLGFSEKEIASKYREIVDFAELERFMDQKLKNYSSGMQVRLAFSVATKLAESDILLIDEVLAVGDAEFQRKCFDYFKSIKKIKKTVVFVSHDMNAIREFCDRACLIEKNEVVVTGSPDKVAQEYSKLFLQDSEEAEEQQDDRWGNGRAVVDKVSVVRDKGSDEIIIRSVIKARQNLPNVIYGLHVKALDGQEVTAMNNRMVGAPDITNLVEGESVTVEWRMLNVFSDGKYNIQLTLVDASGQVMDWFDNAKSFRVKRVERSTTSVMPPLAVKVVK